MSEAIVLAVGVVMGADWRLLALAAGSIWFPQPAALAVVAVAVVGRRIRLRGEAGADARFAETVLAELRVGGSLRRALRVACAAREDCGVIVRRLDLGEPLNRCVAGLGDRLGVIGELVVAAVEVGAAGGRMAPVFEELVAFATAEELARSEFAAATAQVRASLWVLVGGPLVYMALLVVTGRLQRLLALPGTPVVASIGAVLFGLGTVTVLLMARGRR